LGFREIEVLRPGAPQADRIEARSQTLISECQRAIRRVEFLRELYYRERDCLADVGRPTSPSHGHQKTG
jgi:hypothetical protein